MFSAEFDILLEINLHLTTKLMPGNEFIAKHLRPSEHAFWKLPH